ncbi:MAG TPA: FixH family protein [Sulfuricella sp.]|nr:FixH family protein [Sulfuricella sp.]
MTTTLFGGAALIAVLYFLLRLTGISNYWRGVISGALPTLTMMFYSLNHWPGADVVALHLALYVATATVLTLTGAPRMKGQPFKFHWIPMGFISFFLVLAVIMAVFVNIAISGVPSSVAQWFLPNAANKTVYTAFSGEVPHGEAAAKAVSQYLKKSAQERQLGWRTEVSGLDEIKPNSSSEVLVSVMDKQQNPLDGATVKLIIKHLADSVDSGGAGTTVSLAQFAPGSYRALVNMEQPGQWLAVLQIERGQDKFETAKEIIIPAFR